MRSHRIVPPVPHSAGSALIAPHARAGCRLYVLTRHGTALPALVQRRRPEQSISGFRYLDGAVRDYAGEWQREHDRLQAIAGGGR